MIHIYMLADLRVWWCYSWCIGTELYLAEEELTEEVQADQPDDFLEYSTDDIV